MLGQLWTSVKNFLWPAGLSPEIDDVVDGLIVIGHGVEMRCAERVATVVLASVSGTVSRPIDSLVRRGSHIWACTGRYQFDERGTNYLGPYNDWDLFIKWCSRVELIAVPPVGDPCRGGIRSTCDPLSIAVDRAKELGLLPSKCRETTV